MKTADIVFDLVKEPVEALGYELVEVEFVKEHAGHVLTLYIDSLSGITIDDCEKVSRTVDPILDEKDPIEQAYYLSVSSLGLDRPIKKDRDFERNLKKRVAVKLYAPVDKKKEFEGELVSFDEERFVIDTGKQMRTFARKDAALIKPHIDFTALNKLQEWNEE